LINRLQLLRNIGLFDSVSDGATISLARLTLVYAENGRGKTTLAAVLRSLATGDPIPVAERRRLSAQHPPHVVLDCTGGPPAAMFQNNAWNRTFANMVVFDDMFIDQNVYSGLAVEPEHRQNLHDLILGSRGVTLNKRLQELIEQIEIQNSTLRIKAAAIPVAERGTLSVDDFCALPHRADIDIAIQSAERNLAAAREQDPIRNSSVFDTVTLPAFDVSAIERILQEDLPSLNAAAATRVQEHLVSVGQRAEAWIEEGMGRVPQLSHGKATPCPFCGQDLSGSELITHYQAYFSDEYASLKRRVSEILAAINHTHGGDVPAAFERTVRITGELRQFWSRFCDVPDANVDTAAIARDWRGAREGVVAALTTKQGSPLDPLNLTNEARGAISRFEAHRASIIALDQRLQQANAAIHLVKEQASTANPATLAADLTHLKTVKARHTQAIEVLCIDYLTEKAAKATTEQLRDQARVALDQHRTTAFPGYQTAINLYLHRFNAGFRIDRVTSANTRGGPTCTYEVIINNTSVPVARADGVLGEPSFRNTLSAGDRNTLALAFFFASLDQNPTLTNKVVVLDDPISSLDEHRALTTVQEIRRLAERVAQVIVLSHNKPFLCRIWEGADSTIRAALEVSRDGVGSTIRIWDVRQDCVTEHDRRHALLRTYLNNGTPNNREVAKVIRPVLEAFLRVAFPEHFPPGRLLGYFLENCRQRIRTPQEILNTQDTQELGDLIEYVNRFHHDTNLAWETEVINDGELAGFVRRALRFARR
jgi:wobble nucleotide-excising tRNase